MMFVKLWNYPWENLHIKYGFEPWLISPFLGVLSYGSKFNNWWVFQNITENKVIQVISLFYIFFYFVKTQVIFHPFSDSTEQIWKEGKLNWSKISRLWLFSDQSIPCEITTLWIKAQFQLAVVESPYSLLRRHI